MKTLLVKFLFISLSVFTVFISYSVFKSFRIQWIVIQEDFNTPSFSSEEVEDFPLIPNINTTTIPIEAIQARYHFIDGNFNKAISLLSKASKVNPYIFYNEYLLATYYFKSKQLDSAYYYSKKALYGWPKNINHYTLFNQVLAAKKDTLEIFDTYKYIRKVFSAGEEHHKSFIDSYSNAKLGYLIYEYADAQSAKPHQLLGKWQQIYESEDGSTIKVNNSFSIDDNFFISNGGKYKYEFKNDTLNIFFLSNNKLINQTPVYYSPSFQTLIFKNVIRDLNSDNPDRQDQFFKKIDD